MSLVFAAPSSGALHNWTQTHNPRPGLHCGEPSRRVSCNWQPRWGQREKREKKEGKTKDATKQTNKWINKWSVTQKEASTVLKEQTQKRAWHKHFFTIYYFSVCLWSYWKYAKCKSQRVAVITLYNLFFTLSQTYKSYTASVLSEASVCCKTRVQSLLLFSFEYTIPMKFQHLLLSYNFHLSA